MNRRLAVIEVMFCIRLPTFQILNDKVDQKQVTGFFEGRSNKDTSLHDSYTLNLTKGGFFSERVDMSNKDLKLL